MVLMSGKLKSPVIMVSVDEFDWTICVRLGFTRAWWNVDTADGDRFVKI